MNTVLPPFPNGWYVLSTSNALKNKEIRAVKFCGQELVLFRTESGQVGLTDAYCPHLGAHFAKGGTVEGECIRCPFHFFEFDVNGQCTKTGYGTKPSPKTRLKAWQVREKNGFVMAYYHQLGEEPTWEVPEMDMSGYQPTITKTFTLRSHPQETTENIVDIGHLSIVHGYDNVRMMDELRPEGPWLSAFYGMTRTNQAFGQKNIAAEFAATAYGLGFSCVNNVVPKFDLALRLFVLPTPVDEHHINLTIGLALRTLDRPGKINPVLGILPKKLANMLIAKMSFKAFSHDVGQDFEVWENKIYVNPPMLAQGDGPIWQYREWCKQFYAAN